MSNRNIHYRIGNRNINITSSQRYGTLEENEKFMEKALSDYFAITEKQPFNKPSTSEGELITFVFKGRSVSVKTGANNRKFILQNVEQYLDSSGNSDYFFIDQNKYRMQVLVDLFLLSDFTERVIYNSKTNSFTVIEDEL